MNATFSVKMIERNIRNASEYSALANYDLSITVIFTDVNLFQREVHFSMMEYYKNFEI